MILKSLSRKSDSTGQLVNYVMRYIFKEQEPLFKEKNLPNKKQESSKFIIRHNLRSRTSLKGFVKEFQENESFRLVRRKNSVKLFHNIISFSNKDKELITDEILKDITKKFIEERGTNNLYLGTKHEEGVDHIHLHIIVSGTQLNGRSSRVSKQKFHSIKLALDKYQREKYPQLRNSLPEHGRSKRMSKEAVLQNIKANRQIDKQVLLESLEKIYTHSKSKEHFLEQLKVTGHDIYLRNGRVQGITFKEKKFRFSRLGFDEAKLLELDQQQNTPDICLKDFQQIREGKTRELKRQNLEQWQKDKIVTERNIPLMDELAGIRKGKAGKELNRNDEYERSFDLEESKNTEENLGEIDTGISTLIGGFRKFAKPIALETE